MGDNEPKLPSPLGSASLWEWRLVRVEQDVASLNAWREKLSQQITVLSNNVSDNTRRLNAIGIVVSGTFIGVMGGLIIYIVTGHKP